MCLQCSGPMPDPVRDDALYCSASCKLKAQRKRKKERPQFVTKEQADCFKPVAPLGDGPQLSLSFMGRGQADGRQLSFKFMNVPQPADRQRSDAGAKKTSSVRAPRDRDREIHGIVTGHSRPS